MPYKQKYKTSYKPNKILYFYKWYMLPIIFLHESLHYLFALLTSTKILDFKIYSNKRDILFNGLIVTELPSSKMKQILISFAPLLLFTPVILSFYSNIFIYLLLYFITTTVKLNKQWINVMFPSKNDIELITYYDYNKYVLDFFGREKYYEYTYSGDLMKKMKENNILTYIEYKQSRII